MTEQQVTTHFALLDIGTVDVWTDDRLTEERRVWRERQAQDTNTKRDQIRIGYMLDEIQRVQTERDL